MKMFDDEGEMQDWLERELAEREGLTELIEEFDFGTARNASWSFKKVLESFEYCFRSLNMLEVISRNENISISTKEILRPDILAYAPETQSVVIIELKNISGPTRQAGTELSAYCAEVNNYLPFISDSDIVNVIISVEWPTLLRRHVIQDILWRGRKLICLRPELVGTDIRLKVVTPDDLGCAEVDLKLSPHHVGGYQLCLYDDELYSHNPDRDRLSAHLPQMKSALSAMAAKGHALGSHGFAFLWRDLWTESLAPYNITMLNVASFNRLDRFLLELQEGEDLAEISRRLLRMVSEFSPEGHGNSLNDITNEGERFLRAFCTPRTEGFFTWPALRDVMERRADHVAFVAWGIFGERHLDLLDQEYRAGSNPDFFSPQIGIKLVNWIVDESVPYIDLAFFDWGDNDTDEAGEDDF